VKGLVSTDFFTVPTAEITALPEGRSTLRGWTLRGLRNQVDRFGIGRAPHAVRDAHGAKGARNEVV